MSVRDEILKKRESMTLSENKATAPEETPRMKRKRVFKKIKKGIDYLGIGSGKAVSAAPRGGNAARDFRESNHIHTQPLGPSHGEKVQELANMREYLKTIDGKGDHDCGHEH